MRISFLENFESVLHCPSFCVLCSKSMEALEANDLVLKLVPQTSIGYLAVPHPLEIIVMFLW